VKRREFITLLGGAAAAWPLAARAQQGEPQRRIGVLMPFSEQDPEAKATIAAFRKRLQELGWTDGRNLRIDYRYAPGEGSTSLRASAAELVKLQPDVIVARSTLAATAVFRETRTIPIVFTMVADPIGSQLVQSLPRPGGNVTGFTPFEAALGGKWLELLREIAPSVVRAAFLFNPLFAPHAEHYQHTFEAAASSLSVEAIMAPVDSPVAIEPALSALGRGPGSGLIVMPDTFTANHRELIVTLTARYGVPAIYPFPYFTAIGGLISYGVDTVGEMRRATSYVDRILKGERPVDLPVQAPTKFELVINLKTAKALKLDVPWFLQQRADEVIE
jgi:putative ABC transport system substrate-binding protein